MVQCRTILRLDIGWFNILCCEYESYNSEFKEGLCLVKACTAMLQPFFGEVRLLSGNNVVM